eukprot:1582991-Pleurochrysis_carterae.AAC.2
MCATPEAAPRRGDRHGRKRDSDGMTNNAILFCAARRQLRAVQVRPLAVPRGQLGHRRPLGPVHLHRPHGAPRAPSPHTVDENAVSDAPGICNGGCWTPSSLSQAFMLCSRTRTTVV